MSETQVNNFSLISRLFGNLFYRSPTDPILSGVFDWLQQQGLSQVWALSTDKESKAAIDNLQMKIDLTLLDQEYQKLFGPNGNVPTLFQVMIWMCNVLWIFVMRVMCLKQRMLIISPCYCLRFLVRRQHGIAICSTRFIR